MPDTPPSRPSVRLRGSVGSEVASSRSFPATADTSVAASRTVRVNVPTVSSEEANAISPYREISP
jgi:hypothetical protein